MVGWRLWPVSPSRSCPLGWATQICVWYPSTPGWPEKGRSGWITLRLRRLDHGVDVGDYLSAKPLRRKESIGCFPG